MSKATGASHFTGCRMHCRQASTITSISTPLTSCTSMAWTFATGRLPNARRCLRSCCRTRRHYCNIASTSSSPAPRCSSELVTWHWKALSPSVPMRRTVPVEATHGSNQSASRNKSAVIGGYTEQPKHPGTLGALLIGTFEGDRLRFAGKVGTGFTQAEGRDLLKKLQARAVTASPFLSVPTSSRRGARFVTPDLVAQVNFSEWTPDGRLRHPSFQGLREDKPARQVVREKEKPLATIPQATKSSRAKKSAKASSKDDATAAHVRITHPDRMLWPDAGITKLALARYYAAIAPKLLAQAGNRPVSVVRCPDGPGGQCFFQRHVTDGMSSHVHGVKVAGHGEGKAYIYVDDAEGLVSLVQMGTIELHAWNATVDAVKTPDRLIFDLDPAPDVPWKEVKQAALDLRDNLKSLGLISFLKTTGGKGLHVVVPFARGPSWAQAKSSRVPFQKRWPRASLGASPSTAAKMCEKGASSSTICATTRPQARWPLIPCARVLARRYSIPIDWNELSRVKSGAAFSIKAVLARRADPWKNVRQVERQASPLQGK